MAKPASRLSDLNACPIPGHGTNPTTSGSPDVLINTLPTLPTLRVGDSTACGDAVAEGIGSILVNGKPIAFLGSATSHGGVIVTGSGDVLVGTQSGSAPFSAPQILPRHSEQYQLIDSSSGQPVEDALYCVECADGQRFVGCTNGYANTERVFTKDPQSVVVRWGRDAANYLKQKGISF
ncbi:PAAR domain-containing protein [Pseudomonas benzenivorans]|uniref:PAAR domain-containing protein n=1 Tax=Pseudomonas benzenivorans TaxID=556533 RepID=A0ABY5H3F9_9PSED|nr:PAAR domain-containing protein [Pseudomonas benzenivorans]UTW06397.1 PAAR domain-containing protein [Pseudomonas benzenivorans]